VIGLDVQPGDLQVIFLSDGQLSHEFCHHNNLYRDATKNKDTTKSGYFEDGRRVRAQPFRGVKSDGFACGLECFSYIGKCASKLVSDFEFTEIDGHPICNKYVTEATARAMASRSGKKRAHEEFHLAKHYDTEQLGMVLNDLPNLALYVYTEKMHGTSGRTGYVTFEKEKYSWFARLVNGIFKRSVIRPRIVAGYDHVTGTRNTICNTRDDVTFMDGKEHFRWIVHQQIAPLLRRGETVFYEIVGYDTYGSPIMNQQNINKIQDKELKRSLKERFFALRIVDGSALNITYRYGCNCISGTGITPRFDVFVYRITLQSDENTVQELSWFEVERRCKEMGLKTVPVLGIQLAGGSVETDGFAPKMVMNTVLKILADDPASTVDSGHLMEGVVVRVECPRYIKAYKAKGYAFMVLEGIVKEDPNVVDVEEAS